MYYYEVWKNDKKEANTLTPSKIYHYIINTENFEDWLLIKNYHYDYGEAVIKHQVNKFTHARRNFSMLGFDFIIYKEES